MAGVLLTNLYGQNRGCPADGKTDSRTILSRFLVCKTEDLAMVERQIEEGAGESEEEKIVDEFGRVFHFCKQQKIRFYPKSVGEASNGVRESTTLNISKEHRPVMWVFQGL